MLRSTLLILVLSILVATSRADDVLAYWDAGSCGPNGDDHNWDKCGYEKGECPKVLHTKECSSGVAILTILERDHWSWTRWCWYYYKAGYTCLPEFFDADCYRKNLNFRLSETHGVYGFGLYYLKHGKAAKHNPTCIPKDFDVDCYGYRYPILRRKFGRDEKKYKAHYLKALKAGKKDNPRCDQPGHCPEWKDTIGVPNEINQVEKSRDVPKLKNGKLVGRLRRRLIIDGGKAGGGEYPWQVQLGRGEEEVVCGGSIIGKEWVLTAAHCDPQWVKAGYGNEKITVRIKETHRHPHYKLEIADAKVENDVMLLKVHPPFPCGMKSIRSVNLLKNDFDFNSCSAWVTGYGQTQGGLQQNFLNWDNQMIRVDQPLKEMNTIVWNRENCFRKLEEDPLEANYLGMMTDKQICSFSENAIESVCPGDSGSPLLIDINDDAQKHSYAQVGVVSYRSPHCGASPSVYEDVTKHYDFINSKFKHAIWVSTKTCDKRSYREGRPKRTKPCVVTFYQHGNYRGNQVSLKGGSSVNDIAKSVIGHDQVSSIRIPAGCKVTVYEHSDLRGASQVFTEDVNMLDRRMNDKISSVKIESDDARYPFYLRWGRCYSSRKKTITHGLRHKEHWRTSRPRCEEMCLIDKNCKAAEWKLRTLGEVLLFKDDICTLIFEDVDGWMGAQDRHFQCMVKI